MHFTVEIDSPHKTVHNLLRAYLEYGASPSVAVGILATAMEEYGAARAAGATAREAETSEAIAARLKATRDEVRQMEEGYGDGPIPMASSVRQTFDRARATAKLAETNEGYVREMVLAKDAAADSNANEFTYRIVRASSALAQSIVWAEILGQDFTFLSAMDEIMTLTDRTRLAMAPK